MQGEEIFLAQAVAERIFSGIIVGFALQKA
jgi:hypothetical protein